MKLFFILFGICLLCHLLRSIYENFKLQQRSRFAARLFLFLMYPNMILLWVSWFVMTENDPFQLALPVWLRFAGLALFGVGLLLCITALIQMRGVENISRLVTNGVFARLRHPMYLGFICWTIGYPLFHEAKAMLFSSILWIGNILYWRYLEEKQLAREYDEYAVYKKRTWF